MKRPSLPMPGMSPPGPLRSTRGIRRCWRSVLLGASLAIGAISSRADGVVKPESAVPLATPSPGDLSATNLPAVTASTSPAPARRPAVRAVDLATTPSASVVVARSPLIEQPGSTAWANLSTRPVSPVLDSRMNRETLEDSVRNAEQRITPEQAGSALRYLRRKPTFRGLVDLVDLTAPLPESETPAAMAFESRRPEGPAPRTMRNDLTHEPVLRIF